MKTPYLFASVASLLMFTGAADTNDPAHWASRVEQAFLPLSALRADLTIESREAGVKILELNGHIVRLQRPTEIVSIVAIANPSQERRVLKIRSMPNGSAERTLYTGAGEPTSMRVERYDPILRTSLTFEDLGFIEPHHLKDAAVRMEELPTGTRVRLTTKPYGPYGKVVVRLDPETAIPSTVEYFDRKGVLRRTVRYSEINRKGSYRFPLRIEATDEESGRRSIVRFKGVLLGADIMEHEFSDRSLKQLLADVRARPAA